MIMSYSTLGKFSFTWDFLKLFLELRWTVQTISAHFVTILRNAKFILEQVVQK